MAGSSLSLRTALEYAGILGVLFLFFGSSKLQAYLGGSETGPDVQVSHERLDSLVYPDKNLQCAEHEFGDIHIFSTSPLIIYIPSFITEKEADHLVELSADSWTPSTIFNGESQTHDPKIRNSTRALVARDATVQCLEARALAFQGWPRHTFVERLWTQRYEPGGHYAHHYDWSAGSKRSRRVSTFMVYVKADCTGGGTEFPLLRRPSDRRWCGIVDCGKEDGVTFLPRAGAAVYWENFDAEGRGWKEGLHAGLPVESGIKVGLNVWSWYQEGHEPIEGADTADAEAQRGEIKADEL